MKLVQVTEQNEKYYSPDFVQGFNAGAKAQYEADSKERRGRWIRTGEDGYCSVCKCDMPMFRNDWEWEYTETPRCPNCGAIMCDTISGKESD